MKYLELVLTKITKHCI